MGRDLSPATVRLQFILGQHSLPKIHRMVIHEVMRLVDQDKAHAADHLHISIQTLDEQIRLLENVT